MIDETVLVHLDAKLRADLDALAAAMSRDPAEIAAEAIGSFVSEGNWRHRHILHGLAQAQAQQFATDAEVAAVFDRKR